VQTLYRIGRREMVQPGGVGG